jgi:polyisoprenyl-phosphate glycosyltransferase
LTGKPRSAVSPPVYEYDLFDPRRSGFGFEIVNKPMLKVLPQESAVLSDSTLDDIAVVIPVYMGKTVLRELCHRLVATLSKMTSSFSIILVDDRSPDNAWPLICELGQEDQRIRGIQLSRNFGQHYALTAGIDHACARLYLVMDCDLQDAPEDIPLLYAKINEGFDIVVGVRRKEGHGYIKRGASRCFYALFNLLAGVNLDWSVGNYRIFSNRVAEGFKQMREQMRFFPASLSLMGFEVGYVALPHHPRAEGRSSYTLGKLTRLAVNTLLAHSQRPLKIAAAFGLFISAISLLAAIGIVTRALLWGATVTGWASLIVTLCVLGGIQIFVTGIVGIYVGKCFEEAKKRPLYFVRETLNL